MKGSNNSRNSEKKSQTTYLSHKDRISPAIHNRHVLSSAIHNLDSTQISLLQNSPHVGMRFNSNNLKSFLAGRECFSEDSSSSTQVDDPGTFLAGYTTLLE